MWFRKSTYSDYKLKPHKVRCVLWEACGNGPAKRNADPSLPAHTPLRDVLIGTVRKIIDTIKFSKFYLFLWGTYRWSSIMRLYFHSKQKRRQLRKKEKLVIFSTFPWGWSLPQSWLVLVVHQTFSKSGDDKCWPTSCVCTADGLRRASAFLSGWGEKVGIWNSIL